MIIVTVLSCGPTSSLPSSSSGGEVAVAASSSSAFVAPLEGHNLWFTCVNHFWSVSQRSAFASDRRTSPRKPTPLTIQHRSALCLVFNLLAFLIAGVKNRPQIARNYINESPLPPTLPHTQHCTSLNTAVYRCRRVFDSKSHPIDSTIRFEWPPGWRGFVFVRHRGLSTCKWHLSLEPDW